MSARARRRRRSAARDPMTFLRIELDPTTGKVTARAPVPAVLDGRPVELVVWLAPGLGRVYGYEVLALVLPLVTRQPVVSVHVAAENERGRQGLVRALRQGLGLVVTSSPSELHEPSSAVTGAWLP